MLYLVHFVDARGVRYDETTTPSPRVAVEAFRELLERADVLGSALCAVMVRAGEILYRSQCDALPGSGRIHPLAPIDPYCDQADAGRAASWLPKRLV